MPRSSKTRLLVLVALVAVAGAGCVPLAYVPPGVFHAAAAVHRPATVPAPVQASSAGRGTLARPFAASSPWNRPVGSSVSYVAASALVGDKGWIENEQYSVPLFVGRASDPVVTITTDYPAESLVVHAPLALHAAAGTDAAAALVDTASGVVHSFWELTQTSSTSWHACSYGAASLSGSGFGSEGSAPLLNRMAGTRASGASNIGGLITGSDLSSGVIAHALAVELSPRELGFASGATPYVAPAIAVDQGAQYSGSIPMGSRLAIPPGTPDPGLTTGLGRMIFKALQVYGGYVVDQSGSGLGLFTDPNSVASSTVDPVRAFWVAGGGDMAKIMPLIKIVH
jgi:hypothetical protein